MSPRRKAPQVPADLRAYDSWVVWAYEERDGEPTKVPHSPKSGLNASATDSRTWAIFEEAVAAYEGDERWDGLGYVFSSGDPFVGIDLDKCRKPETGELAAWTANVVEKLDGYAEVSPRATGVHVIVRGRKPSWS
jgi:putative DNA primase/helicase